MKEPARGKPGLSRREALKAGAGAALGIAAASLPAPVNQATNGDAWATEATPGAGTPAADDLFQELDAKIEAGMDRYHIPGVAVGVFYQGQEYVRGYGVTNVNAPEPVDGDTLFRIASTTKTFTGTVIMRLVEQGKLDLSAPIRQHLPDFHVADEVASERVTLRECLNHSAGWVGDDDQDFGRGDDALARYVASMRALPQLTPPGTQFAYNNTAIDVAGRVIEAVTGQPYEDVARALLLDPLELSHTRYFTDQVAGYPIAGCHIVVDDRAVFVPDLWHLPRCGHPDGGLISSARDQLRFARFHLGDGRAAAGAQVLTPASLQAMRSNPGPGGTLVAEIDGFGVTFALRRTAEGGHVVMHGGSWPGQHSGFFFVPERDFAMTMLTNSDGGAQLRLELFYDDWALQRFCGLHNPPAVPMRLSPARLADYAGTYVNRSLDEAGGWREVAIALHSVDGALHGQVDQGGAGEIVLMFYRDDYVIVERAGSGPFGGYRANFVRGADGRVVWLSYGGRLYG